MSSVRYRVSGEDFTPPEDHTQIGSGEYVAPKDAGLDKYEVAGEIEVLDWDYNPGEAKQIVPSGPPEPVIEPDGTVAVVHVEDDETRPEEPPYLTKTELGTWECQRCGTTTTLPQQGGEIPQPDECRGCERQGPFTHAGVDKDAVKTALRAADGMWRAPEQAADEGYADLWDDVREFIRDHWDAGDEEDMYDGLAAYALSTWLRDGLTFVPHLMLMGKTTAGKTRLLNTLARVSYRAIVSASATPASMYRLIDGYDTTFFVSEYHGLDIDTRRELDNVVRAGQKRGEIVSRAEPTGDGFEPMAFDPFAHIAVATQYEPDDDIVNRCVQVRSSPSRREMPATLDEERATQIRDRLLYARFRLLESDEWENAEVEAYRILAERNITGRTREKLLSLLTVAVVWDRVDELEPFVDMLVEQDKEAAADSEDALFVEALRDLAFDELAHTAVIGEDSDPFGALEIPLTNVVERYEDMTGVEKSSSWAGHVRSRLSIEKRRRRDGTVIADPELGPKLRRLCDDHGLDWERLEAHNEVEELPDDERTRRTCSECGQNTLITHRHVMDGHHMCRECANEL